MKRITAFFLLAAMLLGLVACGSDPTTAVPTATIPPQTTQTKPAETLPEPTPPMTRPPTEPPQPTQRNIRLTLDENYEGGAAESFTINGDGVYEALPEPVREGFVLLGWFTQPEGGQQAQIGEALLSDQDHTLYAHWEVKTVFTVVLDANGGRISPYNDHVLRKVGETFGTLPEPIREGYKFLGWFTQPEKGTKIKTSTKFSTGADVTLYAQWQYDAQLYWRHVLDSRVQQIPQCRRVVVYLERNAGYKTYIDCPFLTDAGAINPAEGLEHYKVTDEWIRSVQPYIIVKLTTDTNMSLVSKTGMLRRFPDAEIYVFSTSAVSGSEKYQLYCRLYLAKLLYPEYFEDVDLDVVKKELKVKATVYY